jgi:LDH2 family malate/lactate/ureidoglycolate dehydrogenase
MSTEERPTIERSLAHIIERTLLAFGGLGLSLSEAFDTTRSLLYGELRGGKSYHGLDRVSWVEDRLGRNFQTGRSVSLGKYDERSGLVVLDGDNGLGYGQIYFAVSLANRLMQKRPALSVLLRQSYPTNCLGDYASLIAGQGSFCHVGTVSPKKVVLSGGGGAKLPTSGQAFAFPGSPPIVLDFCIGAATNGDLVYSKKHGRRLPTDSFVNQQGELTRDPEEVVNSEGKLIGGILPRGGAGASHIMAGLGVTLLLNTAMAGLPTDEKGSFLHVRRPVFGAEQLLEQHREILMAGEAGAVWLPGQRGWERAKTAIEGGRWELRREIWDIIEKAAEAAPGAYSSGYKLDELADEILGQLLENRYRPLAEETQGQIEDLATKLEA